MPRPPTRNRPVKSEDPTDRTPVVGVGASAGGLPALTAFAGALRPSGAHAFVLVPRVEAALASQVQTALKAATSLPIVPIEDGSAPEAGRIHLAPPDSHVVLSDGRLRLRPSAASLDAIDALLQSLAREGGDSAVGVLLSGTGHDGIEGLRAIRAAGGLCLAEDPAHAASPELPRRAVEDGLVDHALDPAALAGHVLSLARNGAPLFDREALRPVLERLRQVTGVDFSEYKLGTLQRRIGRRLSMLKLADPGAYSEHLVKNHAEVDALFEDLLIHVTRFFRDPATYEVLRTKILPDLFKSRHPDQSLRAWIPGCSTGEEVYSTAIEILDFMQAQGEQRPFQIFASDLSEKTLVLAREGVYPESIASDVPPERLRKYFVRHNGGYRVASRVRTPCIFVRHDLTRNPSFSRLDLVSCRNLLIYMEPELQNQVLQIFHFALRPGGYLILSDSEIVTGIGHLFEQTDRKRGIYLRKPGDSFPKLGPGLPSSRPPGAERPPERSGDTDKRTREILLQRFLPATFVINESLDILQFWGPTAAYLRPDTGASGMNLLKMLREELRADVRLAVHAAVRERKTSHRAGIRLGASAAHSVDLEVAPLDVRGDATSYAVVLRECAPPAGRASRPGRGATSAAIKLYEDENAALRRDLAATIENSQSYIRQYETLNEELTAANEEVVSTNEELRSTNEELEAAKEEVTAANEALSDRNAELSRANSDLTNLLDTAETAIVMLDAEGRIRRMTPHARTVLNLRSTDVGRAIGELKLPVASEELDAMLQRALRGSAVEPREVRERGGRWHMLHVRAYKTAEGRTDGAVLTLVDIDAIKKREEERDRAHQASALLAAIVRSSNDAIVTKTMDGRITSWNDAAERMFGWRASEAVGQSITIIIPETMLSEEALILRRVSQGESIEHYETTRRRKDGRPIDVSLTVSPIRDAEGRVVGASKIAREVTERRRAEAARTHLAAVVESSDDAIITKDLNGVIQSWNRAAQRIFGYTADEIVGKHITTLIPHALRSEEDTIIARLRRGERIEHFETTRQSKDGRLIEVAITVSPLRDARGVVVGASKVARDITEQKRTEAARRFLADAGVTLSSSLDYEATLRNVVRAGALLGTWAEYVVADEDGRLRRVAIAHRDPALTGELEEHTQRFPFVLEGDDAMVRQVLDSGISRLASPSDGPAPEDAPLERQAAACVPIRSRGKILGVLVIGAAPGRFTDRELASAVQFSERAGLALEHAALFRDAREARDEVRRLASTLEERVAQRTSELEAFSYTIAHDLRGPLRAIHRYSDLLRSDYADKPLDAEGASFLQRVADAAARMDQMIQDLLDFSRVSRTEIEPKSVDVEALLQGIREQMAEELKERRAEVEIGPHLPWVLGDPVLLGQVLTNLVANAVKFVAPGVTPRVRIDAEDRGPFVRIQVTDNGIGIEPDQYERVFELFERLHTDAEFPGTGIGLAIVKKAVERMGGRVGVESAPGSGSTFWVEMPRAEQG